MDINRIYSSSPEWWNALTEDSKIRGNSIGCTKYATHVLNNNNDAVEDFADAVKLYTIDKQKFAKKYPNRYNYLESILNY